MQSNSRISVCRTTQAIMHGSSVNQMFKTNSLLHITKLNEIHYFYMKQESQELRDIYWLDCKNMGLYTKSWVTSLLLPHFFPTAPEGVMQCPGRVMWRTKWRGLILGPLAVAVMQVIINTMNTATNTRSKLKWWLSNPAFMPSLYCILNIVPCHFLGCLSFHTCNGEVTVPASRPLKIGNASIMGFEV